MPTGAMREPSRLEGWSISQPRWRLLERPSRRVASGAAPQDEGVVGLKSKRNFKSWFLARLPDALARAKIYARSRYQTLTTSFAWANSCVDLRGLRRLDVKHEAPRPELFVLRHAPSQTTADPGPFMPHLPKNGKYSASFWRWQGIVGRDVGLIADRRGS